MTIAPVRYLVAVTACVSGVAHTYMAAERLEKLCQQEKWSIKIETQGALGTENRLTCCHRVRKRRSPYLYGS